MEKENLIIEAASLVHEDWCKQELEAFFNRAKKIQMNGEDNISKALRGACYKGDIKRNEIYIDVSFMVGHETLASRCLDSFDSFMYLVKIGAIEIKRFTPRNLTDEEKKEKLFKGDYREQSKEENILHDFKYLSADSQKENLEAAISAYKVFEELSKVGISIEEMLENAEIRNLIGVGIHTDWMKRNPNNSNESLKVPYSELDDWTKQQDLTVFDALIKVIKKNNVKIEKDVNRFFMPDYLLEESKTLENLKNQKEQVASDETIKENSKINNEALIAGLFVACKISDDFEILEEFEQYSTFGRCLHKLVVFPKRILLYAKTDEQGNLIYYDADTNEKIEILDEFTPLHSYETKSSSTLSLLEMVKHGVSTGIASMNDDLINQLDVMYNQYGLVTSFEEFYEQKFGKKLEKVSLKTAKRILKLMNLFVNKPIVLSTDPAVATQQLEKIGYITKEKMKQK